LTGGCCSRSGVRYRALAGGQATQDWHGAFLGRRRLPRELSAFELEAFFSFVGAERRAIEQRRTAPLKLGLALQFGFLRMSGRPLAAVGAVTPIV